MDGADNLLAMLIKENLRLQSSPSIIYKVKAGDTLSEIAAKFGIKVEDLLILNNLTRSSIIRVGQSLKIIADGNLRKLSSIYRGIYAGKYVQAGTYLAGIFIPVGGFNWGERHANNGTDIAANCGSPVYAAKEGLVIEAKYGWNNGYGNMIKIQHKDGTITLYGHLSKILVEVGEIVTPETIIGYVGNTGYVYGITGCHLHFEVWGGKNPLLQ